MSTSKLEIRRPRITRLTAAGYDITDFVESVRIQESIGAPVQVQVLAQPPTDVSSFGALKMGRTLDGFSKVSKALQEYAFKRTTDPDFFMEIDGQVLEGYLAASGIETGLSQNGISFTAVGKVVLLDLAAPGLYEDTYSTATDQRRTDILEAVDNASTLTKLFELQREFSIPKIETPLAVRSAIPEDVKRQQRELLANQEAAWPVWLALVKNIESRVWTDIMSISKDFPNRQKMYTWLSGSIQTAGTGGLFGMLSQLASSMEMEYVPEWGGYGRLVGREELLGEPQLTLECDNQQLNLNTSYAGLMPVSRVVIRQNKVLDRHPTSSTVVAVYPASTDVTGSTLEIPPPGWWGDIRAVPRELKDPRPGSGGFDFAALGLETERTEEDTKNYRQEAQKVLDRWAKSIYTWQALESFSGSMHGLPLNLSLRSGVSVKLQSPDGDLIATGLIESVSHSLSRVNREFSASTMVSLSHLKHRDFKLPGGSE